MRISNILTSGRVNISCEIFPPKEFTGLAQVERAAEEIAALRPAFMSVTYGASGSAPRHTIEVAQAVQNCGVTPLCHLTCVNNTREHVKTVLSELKTAGMENVLALRGDILDHPPTDYAHASDLILTCKKAGDFCVGAACYPEGHPESGGKLRDLDFLKAKVDAGVDFLTTQMFFDNNILYNFLYRALGKGIRVPVAAGVMPVVNAGQIKRITALSGSALPPRFAAIVDRFQYSPAAMRQAGIAFATEQIIDLIANGVNNIHIYTMNRPKIAAAIFHNLSEIIGGAPGACAD